MLKTIELLLKDVELFAPKDKAELEVFRLKFLGKKGEIVSLFNKFKETKPENKKELGQAINKLKSAAEAKVKLFKKSFEDVCSFEKIDLTKPEAQGEVIPEVTKIDLTEKPKEDAVQEQKTEKLPDDKQTGDLLKMEEEVRVSDTDVKEESPIQVIEEIVESKEEPKKEVVKEETVEQPKLPENIDKLVKFMEGTGGTVEDYVELNKDYSKLNNDQLLHEYLRKTKPHLDSEDINLIMEDYKYDEELDEQKDIRRKKLAYKEAVAGAKQDLEKRKNQYYEDIDDLSGLSKNHPLLSLCLLAILFSLAGIPPLAGFFAKFYIFTAVLEQSMYFLAIVGLLSTVVAAFYYLRIIKIIYFDKEKERYDDDHSLWLKFSLTASTLLILVYFIFPSQLIDVISKINII